ncbi:citrate synthase [Acidobacteria bacterium AH-259-G07]|nr:citrate synthase [Acidobacteria bacterium AH-259-G07]
MPSKTLSITDNRTGKQYEVPISDGTIRSMDLRQIKESKDDFGLMAYDPGFTNTASCRSKITYVDGEKGILLYRGYPIEQLAEECSFPEVAYLLLHGELPDQGELQEWSSQITHHTMVHENIKKLIDSFPHEAYPMGMLMSTVAALSTYHPEARDLRDHQNRRLQIYRLLAKMPTIAAYAYRHRMGLPYVEPSNELPYMANFLTMVFSMNNPSYVPHPVIEKALDVLFVLHADHEQNCSTNALRSAGSSKPDLYSAATAAIGALAGPLHGGANEAVLRMLRQIGSKNRVAAHIERVKKGELRLMGFGHRVYKNYDPRAQIIKRMAHEVFEVTGSNPLLDVALELERIALEDEYFVERKLYPNVDFYSGSIYQAIGFPANMFPVLFAIARTSGWLAQWEESLNDPEQKIARPRQIYEGHARREMPVRQSTSIPE